MATDDDQDYTALTEHEEAQNESSEVGSGGIEEPKGKGIVESAARRLQTSSNMVYNAVTSGTLPPDNIAMSPKAATSGQSSFRDTPGISNGVSYRQNVKGSSNETMRAKPGGSSASAAFSSFTNDHTDLLMTRQSSQSGRDLARQEASDGSAVVQVLGDVDDPQEQFREDSSEITPETASRLHAALFGAGSGRKIWDNLLDFTPDFLQSETSVRNRQDNLGTTDLDVARSVWLQQWSDVLSSYNDEVWGDLEPLMVEAKREVETRITIPKERQPEGKALDRLRAILAHVRGYPV